MPEKSAAEQAFKPALLRLEDIHPGGAYASEENLYKLRVVGQYLQEEGVPFHVSLIPRSVDPPKNYDVKITDNTDYAKKFLETIIYLQSMGGLVGAHGYTHQSGNTASAIGFEFNNPMQNPAVPDSYSYGSDRIDRAMGLFLGAGIFPAFWETPHYTASLAQYRAFEEQSGLLYENYWAKPIPYQQMYDLSSRSYRGYVTVPTPLGDVEREDDLERIVKILDRPDFTDLASFFYHPFREFKYIQVTYDGQGKPSYVYDPGSPLHQLVRAFKGRGYTFSSIYSLVRFVPAQRLGPLDYKPGDEVLAGNFGPGKGKMLLIWSKAANMGRMYGYSAPWYSPRKGKAFVDKGLWAGGSFLAKNTREITPLVMDFSRDGREDLAFYPSEGGVPYLLENTGSGFVEVLVDPGLAPEVQNSYQLTGDFDGNGLVDIAIYDRQQGRMGLVTGTPQGFGPLYWQQVDFLLGNNIIPLAGDFNGDLTSDVAVLDTKSGQWWVLLGNKGHFIVSGPWLSRWGSGGEWRPFARDVNGDGKCDLVMYNKSGHWQIALSSGRDFSFLGEFGPWGAGRENVPLVEDISGDGKADLIIIASDGQGTYRLDTAISVLGR